MRPRRPPSSLSPATRGLLAHVAERDRRRRRQRVQVRLLALSALVGLPVFIFGFGLLLASGWRLAPPPLPTPAPLARVRFDTPTPLPVGLPRPSPTLTPSSTLEAIVAPTEGGESLAPTLPPLPPTPIAVPPWPSTEARRAPTHIRAPRVGIDADVKTVKPSVALVAGRPMYSYEVATFAAGWHSDTALPGFRGNIVLSGHHNTAGRVFEHLYDLQPGDLILLEADGQSYPYLVATKQLLQEEGATPAQQAANGRWISPSQDERLTLVSCWPPNGTTHRVIIVAVPAR